MLSVKQCKEILKKHGMNLDDEKVEEVREFLYKIARIQIKYEQQSREEALKQEAEGKKCEYIKY
jgi:hypothetical protein